MKKSRKFFWKSLFFKWFSFRTDVYNLIARKIAKVPEGEIIPRWVTIIRCILFPLISLFLMNKQMRYDYLSDSILVYGIKYSMKFFETIAIGKEGIYFEFVRLENGVVTIVCHQGTDWKKIAQDFDTRHLRDMIRIRDMEHKLEDAIHIVGLHDKSIRDLLDPETEKKIGLLGYNGESQFDRLAGAFNSLRNQVQKLEAELNDTWTDEIGTVWDRPTAWAYAQVCKALNEHKVRISKLESGFSS